MAALGAARIGVVHTHLLVDKASLSKIRKLVRADLVKVGARPSVVFDCLVAVTEACTQSLHGRGEKVGEPSRVTWSIDRHRADFCVEDFSKLAASDRPHPKRRLHEVIEQETGLKGLGDDVIESLMDEVQIEEDDVCRQVKMAKLLR